MHAIDVVLARRDAEVFTGQPENPEVDQVVPRPKDLAEMQKRFAAVFVSPADFSTRLTPATAADLR